MGSQLSTKYSLYDFTCSNSLIMLMVYIIRQHRVDNQYQNPAPSCIIKIFTRINSSTFVIMFLNIIGVT